jgi:AI-2 transport protein TqsA
MRLRAGPEGQAVTTSFARPRFGPVSALPRGLIVLLTFAAAVITVAGLQAFRSVLGPVLLALVLVIGVHPISARLRRRGWPPWAAATAMILASIAIVLGMAVALAVSLAELATVLPTYQPRFAALEAEIADALARLGIGRDQVRAAFSGLDFGAIAGAIAGLLAGLAAALSNMVFLLILLLFMGLDAAGFGDRVAAIGSGRPDIVTALAGFAKGTRSYLVVTTIFGFIVAVLDGAALWIMGVPLALLWALVSFITNFIPNVGFIIGLIPPALLALLEGGPRLTALVVVLYCVINFVIQSVIQPKFTADAVDLSLTLTFLSLVFWAWVIGPLGAILAIPLTLLVKALLVDSDPDTRWASVLLTSGKPPVPEPVPSTEAALHDG